MTYHARAREGFQVVPTHEGPKQLKAMNPYKSNLPVTICQDENVKVTMAEVKGKNLSVVTVGGEGAWIRYAGFAFDKVPASVEVFCRAKGEATVEIHKGAADGPVVAEIPLKDTKGAFAKAAAKTANIAKETCDLYFVFKGAAEGIEFAAYQFKK